MSSIPSIGFKEITDMDDSQIVGADVASTAAGDGVKVVEMLSAGKRRRGRLPKNQAGITASSSATPSPKKNQKDEEDVCFICFDGGSLVLCDRRDCPKAYHPACIKRDEAFFKSKVKWKCGWHICRTCQKASYYMCYTCTYSLCKSCTKDADYVNVRRNKGFCGTCMRTIMLIENSTLRNKDMVQVDFDDKTSWEYLFKVYWVFLKEKLSLSLDELSKAKNPWKEIVGMGPNGELSGELNNRTNAKRGNKENPFRDLGARSSKRIKTMKQENVLDNDESLETKRTGVTNGMPFPEGINWATKELLEFVAHMKNGDTSVISRFDVQALLLEHIAKSNLRDPCQKSYIVCDSMLIKLFGKERVGHFEMFKLLDSHFLTKGHSRPINSVRGGNKAVATQLAIDGNDDGEPIIVDYKNFKTSRKVDGQSITVDRNGDGPMKGDDVLSGIGSKGTSIRPHSTEMDLSVTDIETDEKWHYQDPLGKIQGPFAMAMLRKWSLSGLFLPDMRIWRASEKQGDSILLTDAFDGQYNKGRELFQNSCVPTECVRIASDDGCQNRDGDIMESRDLSANQMENEEVEGSLKLQNDTSGHNCGHNGYVKSTELGSQSSPCSASVDIVNSNALQMGSHLPNWDSVKGDNYLPGHPQVSSSVPSSTVSLKPCETQSHQVSNGHGVERWECGSIDMNEDLNKTSEGQSIAENMMGEDNDRKSGKPCEQSWRSSPLYDASNGWDLNSGAVSLARTLESSKDNQDIDLSILPTSTSKLNNEDSKRQAAKNKQSLSSNVPHQDSGPSWSTASCLVVTGSQLPKVAGEWGRYTSTLAKPSAEEWSSDLVPESSLKPAHLGTNHSAPLTSGNGQLTHSSSTNPADNASGWEYSLADESVSDLLAEVEAMESLNALPSPTSKLRSDGELAQGSEHNCFSPVGELSPTHDSGKRNAMSSRNNLQVPSQAEVLDAHKSSGRHSSASPERDVDTRLSNISVNKYEAGLDMQPPAPSVTTWGMATVDTAWRAGPEATGTDFGAVQGNANFNWGGLGQGTSNFGKETAQGTFQENGSINSSTSAGHPPYWGSQQRYVGSKDRDMEGRNSSFGRGRNFWNRQSSYGGPNGVGSFRQMPKGQRVCKFYESGYCKKGASCSYWHP